MADNGLAVGSEAYIKFEAVASVGQGLIERSETCFQESISGRGRRGGQEAGDGSYD